MSLYSSAAAAAANVDVAKKLRRINYYQSGELPEEIVQEILLYLAAGDLQIYKSVSESWKYLISQSDFVSAHLSRSQSPHHQQHQQEQILLLETFTNHKNFTHKNCEYHQLAIRNNLTTVEQLQLPFPPQPEHIPPSNVLSLKASCDGLLFFVNRYYPGHYYLFNPLTAHFYTLPPYPNRVSGGIWALVRDTSINRYKLFALNCDSIYSLLTLTLGEENTSSTDSWRVYDPKRKNTPAIGYLSQPFLFHKELHWLTVDKDAPDDDISTLCYFLYSVHVETLTFTRTMLPPHLLKCCLYQVHDFQMSKGLHLLSETNAGGSPSLCLTFVSTLHLQMFVLEDKLNSVWTKSHRVRLQSLSNPPPFLKSFLSHQTCLVITKAPPNATGSNDLLDLVKVILHHGDQLFLYDLKTQQTRPLGFLSNERKLLRSYFFHSNSLLSPSCSSD